MAEKEVKIETIPSESESYTDDSLYNITSFGTDLPYREIVTMYKDGDLEKPELQRKYVWSKNEASRFIDSVLLGLPVPSIFLAKTKENKHLIVDGYQRIMTVFDYMETGVFSGDGKPFKLSNNDSIHPDWRGKLFAELTDEQKRKIRTSPIHAIVFEQKHPQDDTGMYQIFERINTSGRALKPQEIRNCVYHGKFNKFLLELNKEEAWRSVLGSESEDSRMGDVELILRFFAFVDFDNQAGITQKQINLVKYMNDYMNAHNDISDQEENEMRKMFMETVQYLHKHVGNNVFRTGKTSESGFKWAKKINPVVFDALCTATVLAGANKPNANLLERYKNLLQDSEFDLITRQRTTDTENIKKRVVLAAKFLFDFDV